MSSFFTVFGHAQHATRQLVNRKVVVTSRYSFYYSISSTWECNKPFNSIQTLLHVVVATSSWTLVSVKLPTRYVIDPPSSLAKIMPFPTRSSALFSSTVYNIINCCIIRRCNALILMTRRRHNDDNFGTEWRITRLRL